MEYEPCLRRMITIQFAKLVHIPLLSSLEKVSKSKTFHAALMMNKYNFHPFHIVIVVTTSIGLDQG